MREFGLAKCGKIPRNDAGSALLCIRPLATAREVTRARFLHTTEEHLRVSDADLRLGITGYRVQSAFGNLERDVIFSIENLKCRQINDPFDRGIAVGDRALIYLISGKPDVPTLEVSAIDSEGLVEAAVFEKGVS